MSPVVLGLLAALAVLVLPGGRRDLPAPAESRPSVERHVAGVRSRALAAAVVAAGAGVVVGGTAGVVAAAVTGALTWVVLGRLEPRARRRDREAVERAAPLALDLVAACLASGATLDSSVDAAAAAVGGPAAGLLHAAVASARLGAPPTVAWSGVAAEPALSGLARAVVRAHDTGAPLGDVLPRLASQARASRRASADARVRTAGVRLTGPLGLAFLPAFVLLGVVPVVASWVGALL